MKKFNFLGFENKYLLHMIDLKTKEIEKFEERIFEMKEWILCAREEIKERSK